MEITFKKNYRIELAKTLDKHWYNVWEVLSSNKEKFLGCFPSITTILNAYPHSEQLVKWIAEKGYNEAREHRDQAGKDGTQVHTAIENLLNGAELTEEGFKLEVWNKIHSFAKWHAEYKPEIIRLELPVFSKKLEVPGRVDCIAKLNDQLYVLDWKSSRSIHNSYYLQLSAYATAIEEMTDLKVDNVGVLQLGNRTKKGYTLSIDPEWRDNIRVFKAIKETWTYDTKKEGQGKVIAPVLELPSKIKLEL